MRRTLVLVSALACAPLACTSSEPRPSPPPAAARSVEPAGPRTQLVGVLYEGGTQLCDGSAGEFWVDRTWNVGFVPLRHAPSVASSLAQLEGKVVIATGVGGGGKPTTHGGDERPSEIRECPIPQMRSDWELWPRGTRVRRGESPDLGVFELETVVVVEPIEAQARAGEVWFAVDNPFEAPLVDATLVAHYEGCYGKPGTVSQRRPLGTIAAKAKLEDIPVPRIVGPDGGQRGEHRLDSVQLLGAVEGGALDLDIPISDLGISVPCSDR